MMPHSTRRQAEAVRASTDRHMANVAEPITECVWKDGTCQVRSGLLMAVHDAQDQLIGGAYQRALWALAAHSCGPRPSMELQEGAQVGA
jgi:hypothetical protein